MGMRTWLVVLAAAVVGTAASGATAESSALAARLIGATELRAEVAQAVAASVPDGTAAQLALALIERDELLWAALRDQFAARLATTLAPDVVGPLATTVEKDAATAWREHRAILAPVLRAALETEKAALSRFGCAIGLITGPADEALARARAASKNAELAVLVEPLAGLLPRVQETCDCALRTLPDGAMAAGLDEPARRRETAAALRHAIESGTCDDPFASLPGSR